MAQHAFGPRAVHPTVTSPPPWQFAHLTLHLARDRLIFLHWCLSSASVCECMEVQSWPYSNLLTCLCSAHSSLVCYCVCLWTWERLHVKSHAVRRFRNLYIFNDLTIKALKLLFQFSTGVEFAGPHTVTHLLNRFQIRINSLQRQVWLSLLNSVILTFWNLQNTRWSNLWYTIYIYIIRFLPTGEFFLVVAPRLLWRDRLVFPFHLYKVLWDAFGSDLALYK